MSLNTGLGHTKGRDNTRGNTCEYIIIILLYNIIVKRKNQNKEIMNICRWTLLERMILQTVAQLVN